MEQPERKDVWAEGDLYEPYVGRWSRRVAGQLLDWLAVPEGRDWLDVGSGTGALTRAILDRCDPGSVIGMDSSPGYVAYASVHIGARAQASKSGTRSRCRWRRTAWTRPFRAWS